MIHKSDCTCTVCQQADAKVSRRIQRLFSRPPSLIKDRDIPDLIARGQRR